MPTARSCACVDWPAVDCRDWPEPFDAFPVESPFQVRPDLVKLAPDDDWLRVDRQWPAMLAAKHAALVNSGQQPGGGNIALATGCGRRVEARRCAALARAIAGIAATGAGRRLGITMAAHARDAAQAPFSADFGAAGYRVQSIAGDSRWSASRDDAAVLAPIMERYHGSLGLLAALASSVQEDLVLMERGDDGAVRAALFHVCFPSAWNPAAKLGQDLLALHAPVADNQSLQAAAGRLGDALVSKGPFVRWVWTVSREPRWRAWPAAIAAAGGDDRGRADRDGDAGIPLHFRLERQTTMPLGEGYGLFLIRVQVRPLAEILAIPGRRGLLQAALRSMSDEMARYKNLTAIRSLLLGAS